MSRVGKTGDTMKRLIFLFALMFALPAHAAWPDLYRTEPAGGGSLHSTSVRERGVAYLKVTSGAADGDVSPFITLNAFQSVVCVDTDTGTLAPTGNLEVDVMWNVGTVDTTTASVVIATLSSGTPCTMEVPPGRIFFDITTTANTTGEIKIMGRGGL
jgi:hypothetical protein